jgi:hypothetical protein
MAETGKKDTDQRNQLALIIIGVVVALIGIATWLSGRKGAKDALSYDNLRRIILGEDEA